MVYCGKPSRGCQMCRTRRIKCDETKPTCNQCAKSRRQCPGYKDDFDLVFRNETQATERRARRAVNSKKVSSQISFANQQSAMATTSSGITSPENSNALMAFNSGLDITAALGLGCLSVPIDQQAPSYFVTNYVLHPPQSSSSRGYFDFLVPMLRTEDPDSHLSLAFKAVSLASLANRPNSRGRPLFAQAVGQYTQALKATNLALQNPVHQKTDQTLAAILMLGFFETIASEKTNAMAWYSHIDGATQLVKMRGKKQLRTKVGYSLFVCVRAQMTTSCLSGSKSPSLGADWWITDSKDVMGGFTVKLNLRVAELRAEINAALSTYPRTPEYFQEVTKLIRRAQALEQEYLDWEAGIPDHWRPRSVAWVDQIPGGDITKAEVCPGKVDMFDDVWLANMWNSARVARLFISGVIVRCAAWICSPVDYRTTPEYATNVRLCVDIVTDIIASIPFHLGWRVEDGILRSGDFSGFKAGSDGSTSPKAIGGFFCMWALFSVSNSDFTSDSQRLWAKGRLMFISEVLGLNHAKVLSNFQLRLPSMIIRRDNMVHAPPSAHMMATAMARGYSPPVASGTSAHITSATIHSIAAAHENASGTVAQTSLPVYTLNPLQQREAMQRETWEKERRSLIKKASNSQGDSVERLLANYLAV